MSAVETAALAVLATAFTVARGWPQMSRIAVHRNVSGVSAWTWTLMLGTHVAWIVWAGNIGVIAVVIANILAASGCVAVLVTMARHGNLSRWRSAWTVITSATLSLGLYYGIGDAILVTALTALTAGMLLPQVVKAYRANPSGISPTTWWLAVASSVTWTLYYLAIHHPELMAPNFVIFPCAVAILVRIRYFEQSTARRQLTQVAEPNLPAR